MKKLLIISLITISCGKIKIEPKPVKIEAPPKIDINTNIPDQIKFGPDFAEAARICDERYGADTTESEACFQDYRDYFKPTVGIDLANINSFCEGRYTSEEEVAACEEDLLDIISNAVDREN